MPSDFEHGCGANQIPAPRAYSLYRRDERAATLSHRNEVRILEHRFPRGGAVRLLRSLAAIAGPACRRLRRRRHFLCAASLGRLHPGHRFQCATSGWRQHPQHARAHIWRRSSERERSPRRPAPTGLETRRKAEAGFLLPTAGPRRYRRTAPALTTLFCEREARQGSMWPL